jgi:hypothetical protein
MDQYMLQGQYGGGQGVGQYGGGITIAPNITVVGGSDNKVIPSDGLSGGSSGGSSGELSGVLSGGSINSQSDIQPAFDGGSNGGKIDFKNFVIKKTG